MVARATFSEAQENVVDNGDGTYSRIIGGGGAAAGAATTGNPMKVGGVVQATPAYAETAGGQQAVLRQDTAGNLYITLANSYGNVVRIDQATADAQLPTFIGMTDNARGHAFNGTYWDRLRGDTVGQSVIQGLTGSWWNYAAAAGGILNTTTAVTVKAAAGASVRNYIRQLELEWETLGAATEFAIRDGAAGTVLYRTKLGTVAGRKVVPLQLRGTANTLLEIVTLSASVTGAVYANLDGYTGA